MDYYASQTDFQDQNPIGNPSGFLPEELPKTIFVALTDPGTGCTSDLASFQLQAVEPPEIDLSNFHQQVICVDPQTGEALPGEIPILLDTGLSSEIYEFTWQQNGETLDVDGPVLEIDSIGIYSVIVDPLLGPECPATASVNVVQSSVPLFDLQQPGGFGDPVIAVVNIQGYGDYEFSIDGVNFVPAGNGQLVFQNLPDGEITVIGRDRNGCGETLKSIAVLSFPKFFTPNGDGFNDRWGIPGLIAQQGTVVHIFDRYGKLLESLGSGNLEWDGTYNGKQMPSNEYWFKINYSTENGETTILTGSFSLIR